MQQRVMVGVAAAALLAGAVHVPLQRMSGAAPAPPPASRPAGPAEPVRAPLGPAAAPLAADVPAPAPVVEATPDRSAVPATSPRAQARPSRPPAPPLTADVQRRVDEALGSLGYPWPELGWTLRFERYAGGLVGLADPATRSITVFVKPGATVQQLRVVLAHEIGHALDVELPGQRDRYRQLRGIPADLPWWPCDRCEDYDSPAGDFAEVFAAWLVGPTDFRSRVAPLPDEQQMQQLAPLFAPPSVRVEAPPEQVQPAPAPSPSPSPTPTRRPIVRLGPR